MSLLEGVKFVKGGSGDETAGGAGETAMTTEGEGEVSEAGCVLRTGEGTTSS